MTNEIQVNLQGCMARVGASDCIMHADVEEHAVLRRVWQHSDTRSKDDSNIWRYRTRRADDNKVCTGSGNDTAESHRSCTSAITKVKLYTTKAKIPGFMRDIHVQASKASRHYGRQDARCECRNN